MESKDALSIVDNVRFDMYDPATARRISVLQITEPIAYDNLGTPIKGGLHDPNLGVSAYDKFTTCTHCGQDSDNCPGHFGHIDLAAPVYNPFYVKIIHRLLNSKCFNCDKLKMRNKEKSYIFLKFILIKLGLLKEASTLQSLFYSSTVQTTVEIEYKVSEFIGIIFEDYEVEGIRKGSFETSHTGNTGATANTTNDKVSKKKKKEENKDPNEEIQKLKQSLAKAAKEANLGSIECILKSIKRLGKRNELGDQNLNIQIQMKEAYNEFWRLLKASKCPSCDASNVRIKKQGCLNFFKVPLSKKEKNKMIKSGINLEKDALGKEKEIPAKIKPKPSKGKSKKTESDSESNSESSIDEEELKKEEEKKETKKEETHHKYLHPLEVREHVRKVWALDRHVLSVIFGNVFHSEKNKYSIEIQSTGPDMFFLECIIVSPNRFRPENKADGSVYLHQHTVLLTKILNLNNSIREISLVNKKQIKKEKDDNKPKEVVTEKVVNLRDLTSKWIELQETVNVLYDSSKSSKKDKKEGNGIRQILEKKEGMFRMKMMGKRVNYAGRSVISPDPNISASEVGVPLYIASKLTYPEPVTEFNLEKLKQLVRNGPKVYPGANLVEDENGRKIALDMTKDNYRMLLADKLVPGKYIVYRHLKTGDILLVNRQPTLHKPSIMSHKAKVLPGEKTIRLHYSNCNCYNADFDGDEMNIHLLQNHIARQEAYTISNTDNQYIVPTSGKPIKGLIQDSIVSAVFLTMKGTYLKRDEYFQLIYSALDAPLRNGTIRKIEIQQPAIIKPQMRWTGKQVVTTILKSLITNPKVESLWNVCGVNMSHSTKLSNKVWGDNHSIESIVTVRDNELLTGVLDKNHIGNSEYGLVHSFYEIYGAEMSGELISTFGRLFINYLQYFHGFTCGVDDLVLREGINFKRRRDIENILKSGLSGLIKHFNMIDQELEFGNFSRRSVYTRKNHDLNDFDLTAVEKEDIEKLIDEQNTNENNFEIQNQNNQNIVNELRDKYYEKILKDSNGEATIDIIVKNAINESCSKATECWLKGLVKTFPKNLFATMVLTGAKGSTVNHSQISCMLGQQELEGKRVPRMASGRTLPSFEPFDPNPRAGGFISDRFSTGIRPQEFFFHCMAGREGLIDTAVKTSRSGYLQRCLIKHLEQLIVNYDYTVRDTDGNIVQFLYGEDSIDVVNTKYLKDFKFLTENKDSYIAKYKPENLKGKLDTKTLRKEIKNIPINDTIISKYAPWLYVGSISEKVSSEMAEFINKNEKIFPDKSSKREFVNTVYLKYLNSLIQPGESVGILAAQSIGEPSTQMTLNTFHLAGHGGVNMTLGIPRLREILMTSENNIKTPIMDIPFISKDREFVNKFARNFEKYNLINIIKDVDINRTLIIEGNTRVRKYNIDMKLEDFVKIKEYFQMGSISVKKILKLNFIPFLAKLITKQIKNKTRGIHIANTHADKEDTKEKEIENEEEKENKAEKDNQSGDEESDKESIADQDDRLYQEDDNDAEEPEADNNETGEEEAELVEDVVMKEVETKKEKDDYSHKSKTFNWDEGKIDNMILDKEANMFSFELYLPYTQKNLLLKNILDMAFKNIIFKSIPGVKSCRVHENKGIFSLQLEGINFDEVLKFSEIFNTSKIYTNDIGSVLRNYGIEACRASIVKEINNVFQSYHISVDKRHLGLIADYITYQGTYRSFNRIGMEVASSPFLKMCFETSMSYMIQSCVSKQVDNLKSASASIVMGQVAKCGTGAFDLITDARPSVK